MRDSSVPPRTIANVLQRVLQRLDRDQRLDAYRVWTFWAEEVGAAIAARAQPSAFRGGVLSVRVSSHAWMQELQFMKPNIRERLNARLGRELIRDIYFVLAPATAPTAPAEAEARRREEESHTSAPMPPCPEVRDPRLTEIYDRLVRARAARHRAGN